MTEVLQSDALAEASGDSIAELLSRDPEGYQRQDLDQVIRVMRAQRERWAAAEAAGGSRPRAKTAGKDLLTSTARPLEDLGL
jgi:hypothetical protein